MEGHYLASVRRYPNEGQYLIIYSLNIYTHTRYKKTYLQYFTILVKLQFLIYGFPFRDTQQHFLLINFFMSEVQRQKNPISEKSGL